MGGGGKGGTTTTQKMEIPPEVMARYNAVNARAETVAQTPYQKCHSKLSIHKCNNWFCLDEDFISNR